MQVLPVVVGPHVQAVGTPGLIARTWAQSITRCQRRLLPQSSTTCPWQRVARTCWQGEPQPARRSRATAIDRITMISPYPGQGRSRNRRSRSLIEVRVFGPTTPSTANTRSGWVGAQAAVLRWYQRTNFASFSGVGASGPVGYPRS